MACDDPHHRSDRPPEPTIQRWSQDVPPAATVLDVAAGGGRHARLFADRGASVVAVDRDTHALRSLAHPRIEVVEADLENDPWPLPGRTFDAVVVVDYLWRRLLPELARSVAPGGLLLYETFAAGNERFGRPRNPEFLLLPDELRTFARDAGFDELEFWSGPVGDPPRAVRQRLLARAPGA